MTLTTDWIRTSFPSEKVATVFDPVTQRSKVKTKKRRITIDTQSTVRK